MLTHGDVDMLFWSGSFEWAVLGGLEWSWVYFGSAWAWLLMDQEGSGSGAGGLRCGMIGSGGASGGAGSLG